MRGLRLLAIALSISFGALASAHAEDRPPPAPQQPAAQAPETPAEDPPEEEPAPEESSAEETDAKVEDFPKVFRRIEKNAGVQSAYRACPADVFDTTRPLWRRWWDGLVGDSAMKDGDCDQDPLGCLSKCLRWRSANACFQTARTLQDNTDRGDHRSFQALFAQACALGYAAGCTNRAAGVENGGYDGDPMPDPKNPQTASCLFRSYDIACARSDAWGCTMQGLTYENGVGVTPDPAKAKAAFEKSCAIAPDFVACETARSRLEATAAPKEAPGPQPSGAGGAVR